MKTALILIGVALMIIGAFFTFVTFGFGIICSWPLILVGFILLIVGAVMPEKTTTQQQPPIIIQQPQQPSHPDRYCPGCGKAIPFDSNVCPYCGKKF